MSGSFQVLFTYGEMGATGYSCKGGGGYEAKGGSRVSGNVSVSRQWRVG